MENNQPTDVEQNPKNNGILGFLALENRQKNLIYSPLSIRYALTMLNEGAEGETKAQIEALLGDTSPAKYDNIGDILSLVNTFFIRSTFANRVNRNYQETLQNNYSAEVFFDKFKNAANVNKWVQQKTLGQISNILSNDVVRAGDAILVNTLAINMEWAEKFNKDETYIGNFLLADGGAIGASMMKLTTKSQEVAYYTDDEMVTIMLSLKRYEQTQLQFIAMMPSGNLEDYLGRFSEKQWQNLVDKLIPASKPEGGVVLTMPRFSFNYELNLRNDLQEFGVTDVFDPTVANLSKIYMGNNEFCVSDAVHKTNIDFSEEGVKAAASSAITMMATGMPLKTEKTKFIHINRPFMYIIRDKITGEIWFTGAIYEPTHWEDESSKNKLHRRNSSRHWKWRSILASKSPFN